jgi:hypothetical protein
MGTTDLNAVNFLGFFKYFHFFKPFKVWASLARCPSLPGTLAAAANFFAGIFSPLFTPSDFRKAPGFLIAFCIHFSATLSLLTVS